MLKIRRKLGAIDSRGLTFVEIIVVTAILSMLITVVLLAVFGAHRARRDRVRKEAADRFMAHIEQRASGRNGEYDIDCGSSGWADSTLPCGELDYSANSSCDGSGNIVAGAFRSIAVKTVLENGATYCKSTI
jgi:type II secretory pathway pseudopilin PulG